MFGAPYHCVTVHMPELYRIVSLRSIVTETSERIFHELRYKKSPWVHNHIFLISDQYYKSVVKLLSLSVAVAYFINLHVSNIANDVTSVVSRFANSTVADR